MTRHLYTGALSLALALTACGQPLPTQTQVSPAPLLSGAAAGSGLSAEYFDRKDFTNSRIKRPEQTVNFDWGTGSPGTGIAPNTFSARYSGELTAPTAGTYTFYVTADDGMRLNLNGQSVVDDFTDHGARTSTGTLTLSAGQRVPVLLEYYENTGAASLKLEWSGPGITRQVIPASALSPTASPAAITYQGPIIIDKGGTYSGNWESLDPDVPTVQIKTDEPVTIEYSNIRGKGRLIEVAWNHARLTVRHSRAEGLNPGVRGRIQGRFIQTYNNDSLVVEHNEVVGTLGMHFNTYRGDRGGQQTIRVKYNRFTNMMGQASDGQGGYLSGNTLGQQVEFANLIQLYEARDVPGIEIAWNEVISEPRKSRVEDVINFCRSGGAPDSWAEVHNNYIQGGHAYEPADATFTGAGINSGDCFDGTLFGSVRVHDNQLVSFASGGIGSPPGPRYDVFNNRVVSSGRLADGTLLPRGFGLTVWDPTGNSKGRYTDRPVHDNVVGVMHLGSEGLYRCDGWWPEESRLPDGSDVWCKSGWFNNVSLPDPITLETEAAEWTRWQQKLAAGGVKIGIVGR